MFLATDWSSFWHHSFAHLCCLTVDVLGLDWVDATLVVVFHILVVRLVCILGKDMEQTSLGLHPLTV